MRTLQTHQEIAGEGREITHAALTETDLCEVDVPVLNYGFSSPIGVLAFLDGTFVTIYLHPRRYWVVQSSTNLPLDQARFLNVPHGRIIRAYGYPKGTKIRPGGCDFWHVDNSEGLQVLIEALKTHFGKYRPRTPSPDEIEASGALSDALSREFIRRTS